TDYALATGPRAAERERDLPLLAQRSRLSWLRPALGLSRPFSLPPACHARRPSASTLGNQAACYSICIAATKVCSCGRPMRVALSGKLGGGKGARVVLWCCDAYDRAGHEVRPGSACGQTSLARVPG